MTTVELLAFCRARKKEPCAPDLVWQKEMHRDENLRYLCGGDDDTLTPRTGYHDMYDTILENRSWLLTTRRTYATVLFKGGVTCSEPQK